MGVWISRGNFISLLYKACAVSLYTILARKIGGHFVTLFFNMSQNDLKLPNRILLIFSAIHIKSFAFRFATPKLGEIYATSLYKRNENGDIIVNENGLPMTVTNESEYVNKPIGNIQPKLTMSVSPTFTYKGITLSALFDMKFGGDIFSYSEMLATGNGLAKRTLNRGEENNYMMVFPGVTESGEVNTKQVSASEYYGSLQAEDFIYDASFIKLKELSIGYSFPSSMLKKTPVNSLNVSFVARNLCYLMKHTPGTSPEGGYDTTMFSQAIDYASLPFTRTFGISINLGF